MSYLDAAQMRRMIGIDDNSQQLIEQIRCKVLRGNLPRSLTQRVFVGRGCGVRCVCCAEPIKRGDAEIEVDAYPLATHVLYVMHQHCYRLWSKVVAEIEVETSNGSADAVTGHGARSGLSV